MNFLTRRVIGKLRLPAELTGQAPTHGSTLPIGPATAVGHGP
jgi:hypothetical protein